MTAGATGQSLADVVRAAETARAREPGQKKSGLTIDNGSLVTDPTKGALTMARPAAQPAGRPAAATPVARGAQA
ncbi:MAG: hypothetical protein ACRD00_04240, partial [Thermoanaerobaculia bacterium]